MLERKLSDPQLWIFGPNMLAFSCKTQMLQFVRVIQTLQAFLQYVISHITQEQSFVCGGEQDCGEEAAEQETTDQISVSMLWYFKTWLQQQNRTCSMRLQDISSRVRGNKAGCFLDVALIVARKQNILDKTSGLFQSGLGRKCPVDNSRLFTLHLKLIFSDEASGRFQLRCRKNISQNNHVLKPDVGTSTSGFLIWRQH